MQRAGLRPSQLLIYSGLFLLVFGSLNVAYQWNRQAAQSRSDREVQYGFIQQRVAVFEVAKIQGKGGVIMADYIVSGAGSAQANVTLAWNNDSGNYSKVWVNGDIQMYVEPLDEWVIYDGATLLYRNTTSVASADPPETGWDVIGGDAPAPTVTEVVDDETAPVVASASISAAGTQLTINWTEADSAPVVGTTGLSLQGTNWGAATLSNVVTVGTTTTADISRVIYSDEAPTLSYAPGNFADSADTPNAVEAFSAQAITNNSTVAHISGGNSMATTLGIPTARQNFLMLLAESAPGTPDTGEVGVYATDISSDGAELPPVEEHDQHTPDGFNAPTSTALVSQRSEQSYDWRPQYGLTLHERMEMMMGQPYREGTMADLDGALYGGDTRTFKQYRLPEIGSPRIATRSLYRGISSYANLATYGRIVDASIAHSRSSQTSGSIGFSANAWSEALAMPGGVNEVQTLTIPTGEGNVTVTVPDSDLGAGGDIVVADTDTDAAVRTLLAGVAAIGQEANITVSKATVGADEVFTITFVGALASQNLSPMVAAAGGTVATLTPGAEPAFIFPDEPQIQRDHWRQYRATDLADLLSIDMNNAADPHLLQSAEAGSWNVGSLNLPHYTENRSRNPSGHVAQTPDVSTSVLMRRHRNTESDAIFQTTAGCENDQFYHRQAARCEDHEVWFDVWVARSDVPGMPVTDNYLQREYPLGRHANLAAYNDADDPWGSCVVTVIDPA